MATSTSKSKKAQQPVEPTPVSAWKKNKPNANFPLTLPGGNSLSARKGSIQTFMKLGLVPNSLMSIVQKAINKGVAPEQAIAEDGLENMDEMLEMVDNVVIYCAVEPQIHPTPRNENDRDEELLYVDEVDDEDKMFIFQWATGGTADVEQFRAEAGSSLDAVRAGQALENTSE